MRFILINLLLFVFSGCSVGEMARSVKQNSTPVGNKDISTTNDVVNVQTSDDIGNNQKIKNIKGGGELCEKYLLKKITKEKVKGNQIVKLQTFNFDKKNLSPELKEWIETDIHIEMLKAFELHHKDRKLLILQANIAGATGIASSFNNWFVQFDQYPIKFLSLSEDSKLIFLDKDSLLNYYVIEYGSEFLGNKNFDNLTLDLLQYRVNSDGKSELLSKEQNVKCE